MEVDMVAFFSATNEEEAFLGSIDEATIDLAESTTSLTFLIISSGLTAFAGAGVVLAVSLFVVFPWGPLGVPEALLAELELFVDVGSVLDAEGVELAAGVGDEGVNAGLTLNALFCGEY